MRLLPNYKPGSTEWFYELCAITNRVIGPSGDAEIAVSRLGSVFHEGAKQMVPDHRKQAKIDIALNLMGQVVVPMTRRYRPNVDQRPGPHIHIGMLKHQLDGDGKAEQGTNLQRHTQKQQRRCASGLFDRLVLWVFH